MSERRRSPRYAVDFAARLRTDGGESEPVRVRDICHDAVLVATDRTWDLDTEVSLFLDIPGVASATEVGGRVVRIAEGPPGEQGVAILFTEVSDAAGSRIESFVKLLEAHPPEP